MMVMMICAAVSSSTSPSPASLFTHCVCEGSAISAASLRPSEGRSLSSWASVQSAGQIQGPIPGDVVGPLVAVEADGVVGVPAEGAVLAGVGAIVHVVHA